MTFAEILFVFGLPVLLFVLCALQKPDFRHFGPYR